MRSATSSASTSGSPTSSPVCITGKGVDWGGSQIRPEATGYGVVYFAAEMLGHPGRHPRGQALPGVGQRERRSAHRAQKLVELGAVPITMSDSDGFVVDPDGIDEDKLAWVMGLKNVRRGTDPRVRRSLRPGHVCRRTTAAAHVLWDVPAALRVPVRHAERDRRGRRGQPGAQRRGAGGRGCQHAAAPSARSSGCGGRRALRAGHGGQRRRRDGFGPRDDPGRRAPALDAASRWTSGSTRSCGPSTVEVRETAEAYGRPDDYVAGANIAGFTKVADAMLDEGVI